jgi:predicted RNA-binding protein YlxR (DUF448 family)
MGCGARDDQRKLIRLVVTDQANLKIDQDGSGRGGYLHRDEECWQAFVRRKSLYRAFHVPLTKDAKEQVVQQLKKRYRES